MKYIKKGVEPTVFTNWKSSANANWRPSYDELSGTVKTAVYKSLLHEQGYICCYCEKRLEEDDYHIEHLLPQSDPNTDSLDYANFLCSCLRSTEKGEPLHCGMLKQNNFIPVNPLQKNCQARFFYTANGNIDGLDEESQKTVNILGLNIPKLKDLRKKALEPFLDSTLDENSFVEFLKEYTKMTPDGKYNPFISAVEYVFY